jgi:hypothetical protein
MPRPDPPAGAKPGPDRADGPVVPSPAERDPCPVRGDERWGRMPYANRVPRPGYGVPSPGPPARTGPVERDPRWLARHVPTRRVRRLTRGSGTTPSSSGSARSTRRRGWPSNRRAQARVRQRRISRQKVRGSPTRARGCKDLGLPAGRDTERKRGTPPTRTAEQEGRRCTSGWQGPGRWAGHRMTAGRADHRPGPGTARRARPAGRSPDGGLGAGWQKGPVGRPDRMQVAVEGGKRGVAATTGSGRLVRDGWNRQAP